MVKIDEWFNDIKTVKIWTYNPDYLEQWDNNIIEYLKALASGNYSLGTNQFGAGNATPGILVIINKKEYAEKELAVVKVTSFKLGKPVIDKEHIIFKTETLETAWRNTLSTATNGKIIEKNGIVDFLKELKKYIKNEFKVPVSANYNQSNKQYSKQTILYGPPGTGKTRKAKLMAGEITGIGGIEKVEEEIAKSDGRIKLVQFHPSYSYFDFVEGIEAGQNGFSPRDKIFKELVQRAAGTMKISQGEIKTIEYDGSVEEKSEARAQQVAYNDNYVLIIDEINRANMAGVFGELLYALEYRGKTIDTSLGELVIPKNFYIIGTMNTADVSIAGIDYAVRRRFDFEKVMSQFPNGKLVYKVGSSEEQSIEVKDNKLVAVDTKEEKGDISAWKYEAEDNIKSYEVEGKYFVSNLYNRVRIDIEKSVAKGVHAEDIMPGAAYFLINEKNEEVDTAHLQYKIEYEIVPLLIEYAKNGLFSKRYKIKEEKCLCDLLLEMKYTEYLNNWLSTMQEQWERLEEKR